LIEKSIVDELLSGGKEREVLEIVFNPRVPLNVFAFFEFMKEHITLQSNGMGVGLRESREGLLSLMNEHGYDYSIYKPFISDFENRLLTQHYESIKTEDK